MSKLEEKAFIKKFSYKIRPKKAIILEGLKHGMDGNGPYVIEERDELCVKLSDAQAEILDELQRFYDDIEPLLTVSRGSMPSDEIASRLRIKIESLKEKP